MLVSKMLLLSVAFAAAWAATHTSADILFLVGAAFSFAAATFFPVLVMGIFWKAANKWGACCGMIAGLVTTLVYMVETQPWLRERLRGISASEPAPLWWDVQPIAAGVFGAPVAFLVIVLVSLLTARANPVTDALVDGLRQPD